jgi:hypothetical protein
VISGFYRACYGRINSVTTIGLLNDHAFRDGGMVFAAVTTSLVLAVLDKSEIVDYKEQFPTVPQFVFNEIKAMVNLKLSSGDYVRLDDEGTRSVAFTQKEIDTLFTLLDERTNSEDRYKLRNILSERL